MKLVQAIRNKRDTDLNFAKHGYEKPDRPSLELLDYINLRYGPFSDIQKASNRQIYYTKFRVKTSGKTQCPTVKMRKSSTYMT